MFTLPPLPYSYSALEPILDEATLHFHHDFHHATYVKNLNDLLPDKSDSDLNNILTDTSVFPEAIRQKIINQAGGVFNHNFFWQIMSSPEKAGNISTNLASALTDTFGSIDEFKTQFTKKALSQFGSGWAWLVSDKTKLSIITTSNQDSPLSLSLIPLLTIDVWEHAYYLKYQNRRAEYVEAWWNIVNWNQVSANLVSMGSLVP